jgi:hypothetical protein
MKESGNLQERVAHWLRNQGYPLEMEVASIFRKHKFEVSQGIYYSDPETTEAREIDVVATAGDFKGFLQVFIVIECKSSKDKPWVLFSSGEPSSGLWKFGILSELAWARISRRISGEDSDPIPKLPWFSKDRNGHGVAVAFGSGKDPAYKALLSALKASIDCAKHQFASGFQNLRFAFPVIVLDGSLFEARIDPAGDIGVQEIDEGFVTLSRTIAGNPSCSVHVVTRGRLDAFCTEALEVATRLETILKPDLEELWEDSRIEATKRKRSSSTRPMAPELQVPDT